MAYLAFAAPELATAASGQARVGTLGARVVGETTQVAGVELALASVLADVPADLHTVLLVDRSRSITPAQAAAQLDVIRAYLAATPDRQVALIGFDRVATPLTKGFVRSSALRRAAPALLAAPTRNGSDVGAAVAAAGRLLTEVAGTGRVIILSDDLVASTVPADVAPWASQLPLGTLVHTVALDELGGSVLQRDDDVRFATLAARTQGIGLRLERAPVPADPDARPPALDATILTRPIAVDHLRLVGTAWSPVYDSDMAARCLPGAGDTPVSMGAGTSCRWLGAGAADAPASIDLVGELWGAPWTRTVALDTSRGPGLARDLVDNLGALDADLHPHVTSAAAAVTSFHGLVTRWGGSGGYGLGLEGGGTGSSICGCDGRALPLGVTGTVGRGTLVAAFPDLIAAQIARCRLTDATVALAIETTRDELVAIDATITRRLSARATTDDEACVEAALWDAAMTVPGGDEFHAWSFELRY
jgi:hypothetical protein